MDKERALEAPPRTFGGLPEHVQVWLNSLEPEDISRFKKWNGFIVWAETTGKFGRMVLYFLLALFGASMTIKQVWETFFSGKP